ncbi:hypothetical protein Tco_1503650 [Tanacetum coccineum]
MMTARKRVRPLPTHHLAMRHSVDYSSLDHFSSDDSSSSSSLETLSDPSAYALSDSASSHSSFDHSLLVSSSGTRSSHRLYSLVPSVHRSPAAIPERPSHDSSSAGLFCRRSRSPVASVSLSSPTLRALSVAHADLLPSPKRIRSPKSAIDLEVYANVERSDGIDIDPKIQTEIDECVAYADALRASRVGVRIVVMTVSWDDVETSMRDPIVVSEDGDTPSVVPKVIPEPAQEGAVEGTYETLGDLVQRFHDHTVVIPVHYGQCMRTRSQARNRDRQQQQLTMVIVEEPEFPMADNRTMAQMLQAPIEGYEYAIRNRSTIDFKEQFTNAPSFSSSPSNNSSRDSIMAALLERTKMIFGMSRLEKAISEKNATTPATVKAVEEVCVTCGTLEGPSTPLIPTPVVSKPQKEPEQNPETSTEKVQNPNLENIAHVLPPEEEESIFMEIPKPKAKKTVNVEIQDLNSPRPNLYHPSKLPYPERMKGPRVPIILGRPFLRIAKALIDLYEETLTLRVGKEELVYYADKSEKNKNKHCVHAISVIDFSKDDPFSGSTTTHSDDPSPSSSPVKTSDNSEKFADELALLDSLPPGNDDSTLKKVLHEENFQVNSNPLFKFDDNFKSSTINPLFDEMEEKVKIKNSNVSDEPVLLNTPLSDKEGYFDSEGDVTFLDNLLSDDASHNLASEVISDHEPEQNESSIIFSPRSDPLHHEFAGEPLTLPARNDREFEEYLSLMTVLNEISTSQSQGNVYANQSSVIESLPVSPIPVEDSEPTQEEIDIFLVPDDLIPPGVENDDSEDEVNELPNLDHQDDPSIPRPPPEPPDIKKCFEPEAGILIIKEFKGVSKSHDFMTGILPTLPTLVLDLTFISSFVYVGSEDTIFDPGIITFLEPVAFSMAVSCSKYCSP